MHITSVLIRFFRSFNYDFLRKHNQNAEADPWEKIGGGWFPFVRVPLMSDITTVVGANESGKSHLLAAIQKALSGEALTRGDFCRYSQFFTVEEGKMRLPDFGFQFSGLSSADWELLKTFAAIKSTEMVDNFTVIFSGDQECQVWIAEGGAHKNYKVENSAELLKSQLIPKVFSINSKIALPGSISLSWLRGDTKQPWTRRNRRDLVTQADALSSNFLSAESISAGATSIHASLAPTFSNIGKNSDANNHKEGDEQASRLARDLVFKVAKIDKAAIIDLSDALAAEDEGLANGILQQINSRLASTLNFPKWWVQDREFRLTISARDDDLVFTITDRTQTEYSFGERSNGLRYFLSYYIQYLAHESAAEGWEILLMDEPDAYLSMQGQQDLMKIFSSFAFPDNGREPVQVVYVTHSPFLIDRNHGERIRVLEKGTDDEGTRVVNDASKNHYEPLRSSFGAFVAETTFIGNCNLMVEGLADQVLLAGASNYLRSLHIPSMSNLDLNRITVVPAGSASHIPYLVYLARGRDIEQPSVIVLLDGDQAGQDAEKELKRGGPKRKQLIKPEYVLNLSALAETPESDKLPKTKRLVEIEDLIPLGIAALAVRRYLENVCGVSTDDANRVAADELNAAWTDDKTLYDALESVVQEKIGGEYHVDKVGFARSVVELMQHADKGAVLEADWQTLKDNLLILLSRLARMQRQAERDSAHDRVSRRLDRAIKAFTRDHPQSCRWEDALLLVEELESALDDSPEADQPRLQLVTLRRTHELTEPRAGQMENLSAFTEDLLKVRYAAVNAVQASTEGAAD
jgi:predicted ATP-dependent endonuclease of OLD family